MANVSPVIKETEIPELKLLGRGKVRDIYDLGNKLLIVTTDRVSAFDVILGSGIPEKGAVLHNLSKFWFEKTAHIIPNHFITDDFDAMPASILPYKSKLNGRSMLVKKCQPFPAECVARGHITGSAWKEYMINCKVCGVQLPRGLQLSGRLSEPMFTPATKEAVGTHDENISYERLVKMIGAEDAKFLRDKTLELYKFAADYAFSKGIIIADTKFEFGKLPNGEIILIDEALTPDSSRFWLKLAYKVGMEQDSMDKQVIRNYLEDIGWNKQPPAPPLPQNIIDKASSKYVDIMNMLVK
ncbi:phosphoribosylaminoimidazolesuccinocarboxamide synthase [Deferribacterales bacterium RsTz2092]